jgi:hypothetical protein
MSLHDSAVCFVTAHLAAHRDNVAGRNSDYKNIIQKIVFVSEYGGYNKDPSQSAGYNEESDLNTNSFSGGGAPSGVGGSNNHYYENNATLKVGRPQRGAALTQGRRIGCKTFLL